MAKIYFDKNNLKCLVSPDLEKSINNLKKAVSTSNMLYIPYDFNYRNYLQSLGSKLQRNIDTINNINNIIKNSSKAYSNINNDISDQISDIENYSISLRQSAIK